MPYADESKNRAARDRYEATPAGKLCRLGIGRRYHAKHPHMRLLLEARKRAKKLGVPCNLTPEDVAIPVVCPVLGIPLAKGVGKCTGNSPSLDRIDAKGGYTKDNVIVVSFKANTIKSDATVAELQMVVDFYKKIGAP